MIAMVRAGALALRAALCAAGAAAQEAPPLRQFWLDDLVVTASRARRRGFDAPVAIDVLAAEELAGGRARRSLPEALAEVAGGRVQRTGHAQGSPFLRGLTGYHTLLLIDGVRLNNSTFRSGPTQYWGTVDPLSLSRLEIVKGAGSALYGSDAVGGVAQAFTRDPPEEEGALSRRRLFHRYAGAEGSNVGRLEAGGRSGAFGWSGGVSLKDFGDLVGGRDVGLQPKTGYRELDADLRLDWRLDPESRLAATLQHADQSDAWRSHTTVFGTRWMGAAPGADQERILDNDRRLAALRYEGSGPFDFIERARVGVSYQEQLETEFRRRANGNRILQGVDARTAGVTVSAESPSPLGRWTYGAEFYHDAVESRRADKSPADAVTRVHVQGPVADGARFDLFDAYAQNETSWLADRLEATAGGHFTHARVSASSVQDPRVAVNQAAGMANHTNSAVASLRLLLKAAPGRVNVFAGVSQAVRAPNLSDLTRFDIAEGAEIETPVASLAPERFLQYEAGLRVRLEGLRLESALYYTDIRDLIVRAPTGSVVQGLAEVTKKNAGRGFTAGWEASASVDLAPRWTAAGQFAWMYGEVDAFPTSAPVPSREPLDKLMPPAGQLRLEWEDPSGRFWAQTAVALAGRARKLSTRDAKDAERIPPGGTPGYAVFSLRGGARLRPELTVTAALENLANQDYRRHASGLNEAGTNVILSWDWSF